MSKQFHEINWDKVLYKRAMKDYKKLAALYADVLLSRETWEGETDMWMNKYYKLLKKYKSLKKENKALYKEIKYDYSHVGISEGVLKREWDTPEEDKAWGGLLDESSGVINSSGNSSIEDAVEAVKDDDLYKRGEG